MNDFNRCNKLTGIYYLKKSINAMKIRITLNPREKCLILPKYDEYTNDSNSGSLPVVNKVDHVFHWQEKVFSVWEFQRYSNIHNCVSDIEIKYHEKLKNCECEPKKIFTYVHEDYRLPLPVENGLKNTRESISHFNSCLGKLNLNNFERTFSEDTNSVGHLFKSQEDIGMEEEQWTAMHVVFDSSEYNEESQLLLKQESILLSLYKNSQNCLIISPDVNELDSNAYDVESETGVKWGWQYAVEVEFEKGSGEELRLLLGKLMKKWEKTNKQQLHFTMSPLGKKQFFLTLEILTAANFEMDNLYIEYNIKIPENLQCSDSLHGRTHVSKSSRKEKVDRWNFGHVIEIMLETTLATDAPVIQIFLEVISMDWWGRHRTEGYAYRPLTLQSGQGAVNLSCSRPEELNKIEAENRRFFVGGCHLIKELDVLAKPSLKDAKFRYVASGTIKLRWSIVSQAPLPGTVALPLYPGTSSASALLLGAEAVLRQYKKAKARLAAATKDLNEVKYEATADG